MFPSLPHATLWPGSLIVLGLLSWLWVAPASLGDSGGKPDGQKLPLDELLLRGHYDQIPPGKDAHGKAVWAFARYHLAPSGSVYDAAWEAHQKGDVLGTFVVAECHREGIGVRRDEKLQWKLHHAIRQKLEKKKDLTPVELYILAHTEPVDEDGVQRLPEGVKLKDYEEQKDKQRLEWLERAAKAGFAQACDALGWRFQGQEDYAKALAWFDRAGELGLAAGLRSKGFCSWSAGGRPRMPKRLLSWPARRPSMAMPLR
jgi:hypothetical protein